MQAPFVGILQILVYGGAIMMLFTFVIMMINPAPKGGEIPGEDAKIRWKGLVSTLVLLAVAGIIVIPPVYHAAMALPPAAVGKPGFGGIASLAELIFRDPANNPLTVSFELISFLILVGIIAARSSNLSEAARERIAADIKKVSADPLVAERLAATAQLNIPGNAAEFAALKALPPAWSVSE